MSDYPNIVWILVDSVRSYATDVDDRGKLPMMIRFGEHSVEFMNVVTSAPSTIMAISAMMTSLPSYMIARNYDYFMFDNRYFACLNDLLEEYGYLNFAFFRHPHPREKLRNMLAPVPRRFWEPHLRHRDVWSNRDLHAVIQNVLGTDIPQPAFLFAHFTARYDPEVSEIVESALQSFLSAGFNYKNSIFVLCSDHGYPDPNRGFDPSLMKGPGMTHDLVLSDDNIKIPLYISFPTCKPAKITNTVSSLDIMPTILDLASIPVESYREETFQGRSLRDLIEQPKVDRSSTRYVRSDARLMYQTGRITAIRSDKYKYLRIHDEQVGKIEAFYDLNLDPHEKINLVDSPQPVIRRALELFRSEFDHQEKEAIRVQVNALLFRLQESMSLRNDPKDIWMIIEPGTADLGSVAFQVLRRKWPDATIHLTSEVGETITGDALSCSYHYAKVPLKNLYQFTDEPPSQCFDLKLVFTIQPTGKDAIALNKLAKQVRGRRALILDCDMESYTPRRFWYYRFRAALARLRYIVEEPMMLFDTISDIRRVFVKRLKRW